MLHLSVGSTRRGREELGSAEAAGQTDRTPRSL